MKVEKITYKDHLQRTHTAIQFYKTHETTNVKFHNIGNDIDLVLDDKRYDALHNAIEYLKKNGGTLIFLDSKVISQEQAKEFGVGAQILKDLGIKNIKLLTTHKETEFVGLCGFGLDVVEKIVI
jgi:3,4-dihydroxy 2-butanone 4-phosphate synthase/GTP cyclohydrolase II